VTNPAFSFSLYAHFFPPFSLAKLLHFSHDQPYWSLSSSTITFRNFPGIYILLSEVSKFQHHTSRAPKVALYKISSLSLSRIYWWKVTFIWKLFFNGNAGFNFTCIISYTTEKYSKYSNLSGCIWSIMISVGDDCIEVLILAHSLPFHIIFQFQFTIYAL
jgi:hypothetical protein